MFSSNSTQVSSEANYIEDVFSTYLYTGNSSTQTINNGIDLAGKGGMVWIKSRSAATTNHRIFDTNRGVGNSISSNLTTAQSFATSSLDGFLSSGFSIQGFNGEINDSARTYASWTFRKQPKFFDVVTWTGNGASQNISHNLGSQPGMVIVKRTNATEAWGVAVRQSSTTYATGLSLNTTDAAVYQGVTSYNTYFTSTYFDAYRVISAAGDRNTSGATYVAYLFAHDAGGFGLTGTDNVISCGSFTTDGFGIATVNLGYEPQWLLYKDIGSGGYDWQIIDNMRGFTTSTADKLLQPNTSAAESSNNIVGPTATGFHFDLRPGTYIYIAIRRGPMKVPTVGTSVYNAYAASDATLQNVGFPVDVFFDCVRTGVAWNFLAGSRLIGTTNQLITSSTGAETTVYGPSGGYDKQNSFAPSVGGSANNLWYAFKRAPGFMDVVAYTGTGSYTTKNHGLGAVPDLVIIKRRNGVGNWWVYRPSTEAGYMYLNATNAISNVGGGGNYWPATNTTITAYPDTSGETYIAYLFASLPGISKVGSYTGNGSSQTINCGFSSGARFILIKRTDSTGDWYVWDTARGIVAANDPHLSLNTSAAEVTTDDSVDTDSTGFIVNQVAATNINVTSATYIYLAIA